jgi:hypothetical protein
MKNKFVEEDAVENFISSMDEKEKMLDQIENACRDAFLYNWNQYTLDELIREIEKKYGRSHQ